jgi:hypothetical protein
VRIGDLSIGIAKLETAMEMLQARRHAAAAAWDDETFRQFEERYFAPLEQKVRRALDAAHRLAQVLERARRECGPE